MKREKIRITGSANNEFGDNYELIFEDNYYLYTYNIICGNDCIIKCGNYYDITCGNQCKIKCGVFCNITCGNDCEIHCGHDCNITCRNNCEINFGCLCYIKAGEGSQLKLYSSLKKTISKHEEFIWWYSYVKCLVNTFEDVDWQRSKPDKYKELYFVTDELDSATLF